MTFLTKILRFAQEKRLPRKHVRNAFIDSLRILVKGGNGGYGTAKYGGVGGHGGDVFIVAKEDQTLLDVINKWPKKRIAASHGKHSHQRRILGSPGESTFVEVPVGVTVLREDGKLIGELNSPGDEIIIARGGAGGSDKNGFLGMEGQTHIVVLDLKLIADVGLVGFPNAGKSTLLKAISRATPKIASYPFTTIRPNIGMIRYKDYRQISVADLPGLIEGAHLNVGMGHKFLKHIERTKIILIVVDINGFQLSQNYDRWSCLDTIVLLNKELEMYQKDLLDKPAVIVINKMDVGGAMLKYNAIKEKIKNLTDVINTYPPNIRPERAFTFEDIIPMSAQCGGEVINYLKERLRTILDENADKENQEIEKDVKLIKDLKQSTTEENPKLV